MLLNYMADGDREGNPHILHVSIVEKTATFKTLADGSVVAQEFPREEHENKDENLCVCTSLYYFCMLHITGTDVDLQHVLILMPACMHA